MNRFAIDRRSFLRNSLVAAAALPLGVRMRAQAAGPRWVMLGTDTGKGIYRARFDAATGAMGVPVLAAESARPDFFAMHPTLPILYTVNSVAGAGAAVSAYRVDAASGALTLLNQRQTHGDGPCALSVDRNGWCVFAANYAGGSVTAFQLGANGALTETIGIFKYAQETHGPIVDRQDAAHLHCVTIAPGNRFVVTCDLGDDVLLVFPFVASASASVQQPLRFAARAGSGPRHVVFHPSARWMYCIHELDCTIDLYDWKVAGGVPALTLRDGGTVSTLATDSAATGNSACEVLISDDGRFLYACTRGEDSISVYRIEASTGFLRLHQRVACGGKTPRYIAFDPTRSWLLCCNQAAPGSVTVFAVDPESGRISETPQTFAANTPMCVQWV